MLAVVRITSADSFGRPRTMKKIMDHTATAKSNDVASTKAGVSEVLTSIAIALADIERLYGPPQVVRRESKLFQIRPRAQRRFPWFPDTSQPMSVMR